MTAHIPLVAFADDSKWQRDRLTIGDWGDIMRLCRRAAMLAGEEQRAAGRIADPLESSILLYTDDPTTSLLLSTQADLAAMCKASAIEGVVCIMGENFPPASHEADRDDLELPRIAAMWFPAPGEKCPRCRNYTMAAAVPLCSTCSKVAA